MSVDTAVHSTGKNTALAIAITVGLHGVAGFGVS